LGQRLNRIQSRRESHLSQESLLSSLHNSLSFRHLGSCAAGCERCHSFTRKGEGVPMNQSSHFVANN
jgi:hypothetical protein